MSTSGDIHPPKWPLRILRFFVKRDYLEELEGDLEELFHENAEHHSLRKARRLYVLEVIKLLRPTLLRNTEGNNQSTFYAMLKNYFKISIRSLGKNPLNSFINIFGLAVAISICVFLYAFARWTYSTDQFHEHKDKVFLVTFFAERDGTQQQYGRTPRPLGEMLRQDFAPIKNVCRLEDRNVVMKVDQKVFHERVRFADPEFLEMFTFPLKWGTTSSLQDINSIILSEPMAIKYFGAENPVSQTLLVKFGKDQSKRFTISGVAAAFPKARTISFDFLVHFDNLRDAEPGYQSHNWNELVNATFIQVEDPSDIQSISSKMGTYKSLQNTAVKEDWAISSFGFEPLATLHERAGAIRDDISRSSDDNYATVIFLIILGGMMMALACFNYINIAIVSVSKRLKEIGIRKSMGATRQVVIVQFLLENVIITFLAMILGLILAITLFIPGFEGMWSFSMGFSLMDGMLWIYLLGVLLFTSVASGMYPSLYISKFQVVGILKGKVKFGQNNRLTKSLLGFQLIVAFLFITSAVAFTQNSAYMAKRSWGYDQAGVMYAVAPDQASFEQLRTLMKADPAVLSASGSVHHIGKRHTPTVIHFPDQEYEVDQLAVGAPYFETMGLELTNGRTLSEDGGDQHKVVVNEHLVKNLLEGDPIGRAFKIDTVQYEVVGVVKDFHSYSFNSAIRPTIFTLAENEAYRYLTLNVQEEAEINTYINLQDKWSEVLPDTPFEGGYQEDVWGFYFEEIRIHGLVWKVFAFLAISLAALGLYGLITFNVLSRIKEFSIRKVLGADLKNISTVLIQPYLFLVLAAFIVGAPVSYYLVRHIIETTYAYHKPVTFSTVGIALVILLIVFLITAFTQIRSVQKSNPVDGLKME